MADKKPRPRLRFTIVYELGLDELDALGEIVEKLQERGSATVVDVEVVR